MSGRTGRGRAGDGIEKLGPQRYRVRWTERATGARRSRIIHGPEAEARAFKYAIEDAQARREYVAPDRITLGDWLDSWLEHREAFGGKQGNDRRSTQERYASLLGGTLRQRLGSIPLQELTVDDLEQYYLWAVKHEKTNRGTLVSAETVKKRHKVLKLALEAAVKRRVLAHSPATYASTPRCKAPNRQAFTLEDLAWIDAALYETRLGLIARIAARTGLRLSEVLGIHWRSVDLPRLGESRRPSIMVAGIVSETRDGYRYEPWAKTAHSLRTVKIDADLADTLRALKKAQTEARLATGVQYDLVCATVTGGLLRPSRVTRDFTSVVRVLEDAGVLSTRGATFHTLRHTHATLLRERGVEIEEVSRRLGHSKVSTTADIYVHSGDRSETAVDAIDSLFAGAPGSRNGHEMGTEAAL